MIECHLRLTSRGVSSIPWSKRNIVSNIALRYLWKQRSPMKKLILFSACSLDGFIAGEDGEVGWLFSDQDYGYSTFLQRIDTSLMGAATYRQVLGFGEFPYKNIANYVFTLQPFGGDHPYVAFITRNIPAFVEELKTGDGKDIWLIGGGEINGLLLSHQLIDEIILSIHPVVLGKGVPLFRNTTVPSTWDFLEVKSFSSGLVQLSYAKPVQPS